MAVQEDYLIKVIVLYPLAALRYQPSFVIRYWPQMIFIGPSIFCKTTSDKPTIKPGYAVFCWRRNRAAGLALPPAPSPMVEQITTLCVWAHKVDFLASIQRDAGLLPWDSSKGIKQFSASDDYVVRKGLRLPFTLQKPDQSPPVRHSRRFTVIRLVSRPLVAGYVF